MVGTKVRSYAFAVRDEMLSAGEYGGAMVIICDGEVCEAFEDALLLLPRSRGELE